MAKNSQNISISLQDGFGDYDFEEVVSVSVDGVQADMVEITPRSAQDIGRVKVFRAADTDYGTLSVTYRAPGNAALDSHVGELTNVIVSQGATTIWFSGAVLQSFAWNANVGELQEYSATLKLRPSIA